MPKDQKPSTEDLSKAAQRQKELDQRLQQDAAIEAEKAKAAHQQGLRQQADNDAKRKLATADNDDVGLEVIGDSEPISPDGLTISGTPINADDANDSNRLRGIMSLTGRPINIEEKNGKTWVTVPNTSGMSTSQKVILAGDIIYAALAAEAYNVRPDGTKEFLVDTTDYELGYALICHIEMLGHTVDSNSKKEVIDKVRQDANRFPMYMHFADTEEVLQKLEQLPYNPDMKNPVVGTRSSLASQHPFKIGTSWGNPVLRRLDAIANQVAHSNKKHSPTKDAKQGFFNLRHNSSQSNELCRNRMRRAAVGSTWRPTNAKGRSFFLRGLGSDPTQSSGQIKEHLVGKTPDEDIRLIEQFGLARIDHGINLDPTNPKQFEKNLKKFQESFKEKIKANQEPDIGVQHVPPADKPSGGPVPT